MKKNDQVWNNQTMNKMEFPTLFILAAKTVIESDLSRDILTEDITEFLDKIDKCETIEQAIGDQDIKVIDYYSIKNGSSGLMRLIKREDIECAIKTKNIFILEWLFCFWYQSFNADTLYVKCAESGDIHVFDFLNEKFPFVDKSTLITEMINGAIKNDNREMFEVIQSRKRIVMTPNQKNEIAIRPEIMKWMIQYNNFWNFGTWDAMNIFFEHMPLEVLDIFYEYQYRFLNLPGLNLGGLGIIISHALNKSETSLVLAKKIYDMEGIVPLTNNWELGLQNGFIANLEFMRTIGTIQPSTRTLESGLVFAIMNNKIESVRFVHEHFPTIIQQIHVGCAVRHGMLEIYKFFYENGMKCKTPLLLASETEHLNIIQYLFSNGNKRLFSTSQVRTSMNVAIIMDHLEIVEWFHENLEIVLPDNALMLAIQGNVTKEQPKGGGKVTKWLLERGDRLWTFEMLVLAYENKNENAMISIIRFAGNDLFDYRSDKIQGNQVSTNLKQYIKSLKRFI